MAIAGSVAPRFEMGRVAKRTFSVIGNNLVLFALLSFIPAVPLVVMNRGQLGFYEGAPFDIGAFGLSAFAGLVYLVSAFVLQAAVVHGTVADLNGRQASFGDCLSTGINHFVPLFLIALLYVLFVAVGLILLIVPGIIVAVALSVTVPVRVVERTGVIASFGRSRELTNGHGWAIFGLFVAYFVIQMIISAVFAAFAGLGFLTATTPDEIAIAVASARSWPVVLLSTIGSMINAVIGTAGIAAIYYELRQVKEGIGPEALAAVFD